jgi:hypothetical protein
MQQRQQPGKTVVTDLCAALLVVLQVLPWVTASQSSAFVGCGQLRTLQDQKASSPQTHCAGIPHHNTMNCAASLFSLGAVPVLFLKERAVHGGCACTAGRQPMNPVAKN